MLFWHVIIFDLYYRFSFIFPSFIFIFCHFTWLLHEICYFNPIGSPSLLPAPTTTATALILTAVAADGGDDDDDVIAWQSFTE